MDLFAWWDKLFLFFFSCPELGFLVEVCTPPLNGVLLVAGQLVFDEFDIFFAEFARVRGLRLMEFNPIV